MQRHIHIHRSRCTRISTLHGCTLQCLVGGAAGPGRRAAGPIIEDQMAYAPYPQGSKYQHNLGKVRLLCHVGMRTLDTTSPKTLNSRVFWGLNDLQQKGFGTLGWHLETPVFRITSLRLEQDMVYGPRGPSMKGESWHLGCPSSFTLVLASVIELKVLLCLEVYGRPELETGSARGICSNFLRV